MNLSIVIPCYNEAGTIRQIVERVRASPVTDKEIIVVDDCSRTAPATCCNGRLPRSLRG